MIEKHLTPNKMTSLSEQALVIGMTELEKRIEKLQSLLLEAAAEIQRQQELIKQLENK